MKNILYFKNIIYKDNGDIQKEIIAEPQGTGLIQFNKDNFLFSDTEFNPKFIVPSKMVLFKLTECPKNIDKEKFKKRIFGSYNPDVSLSNIVGNNFENANNFKILWDPIITSENDFVTILYDANNKQYYLCFTYTDTFFFTKIVERFKNEDLYSLENKDSAPNKNGTSVFNWFQSKFYIKYRKFIDHLVERLLFNILVELNIKISNFDIFKEMKELTIEGENYGKPQKISLRNSNTFYFNGELLKFDKEFFIKFRCIDIKQIEKYLYFNELPQEGTLSTILLTMPAKENAKYIVRLFRNYHLTTEEPPKKLQKEFLFEIKEEKEYYYIQIAKTKTNLNYLKSLFFCRKKK